MIKSLSIVAQLGIALMVISTGPVLAQALSINVNTNDETCGSSNGSISATGNGGSPPYIYSINGSIFQGNGNFTGLTAGNYIVYVQDGDANVADTSVTINNISGPAAINLTVINKMCEENGSITINSITGGTSPYTFKIGTGAYSGNNVFSNLAVGNYNIAVKDVNNCEFYTSVTISNNPGNLNAYISSKQDVACFGANDGFATIEGISGTPPYSYSIDGISFQSSGIFSNLIADSYTCTVKDVNGCEHDETVTISEPAAITLITSTTPATCSNCNDGKATVSVSGGTSPYTYSWAPSGGNDSVAINLPPGTYTCSITDANNCTTSATETVDITTGIRDIYNPVNTNLYPNPAKDVVTLIMDITISTNLNLKIYNILGKEVFQLEQYHLPSGMHNISMDLSNLQEGTYIYQITSDEKTIVKKLNIVK